MLSVFDPENLLIPSGPDWMTTRRSAAAKAVAEATLPSTDEEIWRYSRVDELDLDGYRIVSEAGAGNPNPNTARTLVDAPAAFVHVHNGVVRECSVDPAAAAQGLYVGPVTEWPGGATNFGAAIDGHGDVFAQMNEAAAPAPLVVSVPAGVVVAEPIVIAESVDAAKGIVLPRLLVHVAENAEATVIEMQSSPEGCDALVIPVVELIAEQASRLRYLNVQALDHATWQIGHQHATVGRDANLVASVAAFGGGYARVRTDCRMIGRGSSSTLSSLYFGEEDQTLDFRTFQDHVAPDSTSNLVFKGALDDRSRSIYTGLIRVRPNASGTNAFQTNRNLKLSDEAWAESVPNLEIENNDVRCSHASTVGPVDEDQRFYLESRGVPPDVSERLILGGFFDEVLNELAAPQAVPLLRRRIANRIERHAS